MKTLYASALLLFITGYAMSQSFNARAYVEFTHISPKQGISFGKTLENNFSFGAFGQAEINNLGVELEYKERKVREQSFAGIYMAFPCKRTDIFALDFEVRTGFKNGKYFAIMPSIMGTVALGNRVELLGGVSVRNFRPSAITGLSIKL